MLTAVGREYIGWLLIEYVGVRNPTLSTMSWIQLWPSHQVRALDLWTVELVHVDKFDQPVGQVGVPRAQHLPVTVLTEGYSVANQLFSMGDRNQIVHNWTGHASRATLFFYSWCTKLAGAQSQDLPLLYHEEEMPVPEAYWGRVRGLLNFRRTTTRTLGECLNSDGVSHWGWCPAKSELCKRVVEFVSSTRGQVSLYRVLKEKHTFPAVTVSRIFSHTSSKRFPCARCCNVRKHESDQARVVWTRGSVCDSWYGGLKDSRWVQWRILETRNSCWFENSLHMPSSEFRYTSE